MSILFWDFDGTLAYSESLWSSSVYKALLEADADMPVSFEEIKKCMSHGFTWHTPERDYTGITGEKWWDFMNLHFYNSYRECGVFDTVARNAAKRVRAIIKRTENYTLFDDTVKTLQAAKELGHTNVILSNNYPDLDEVLERLGITPYFDGLIVSAVEGYDKPRQELFEIAKNRFPGEAYYMIGDNPKADILGGKAAGMTTILVHKGYHEQADFCFDDLYSIVGLLSVANPDENMLH